MIQPSFPQSQTDSLLWALPICQMDWERTPPAVQDYIERLNRQSKDLEKQVDALQGRVDKTSQTSSKPPSSDSPFNKPKRKRRKSSGKRGGKKGHRG